MIPSQKIELFNHPRQHNKANPEEAATRLLLQISDQDYTYDLLNVTDIIEQAPPKLQKHRRSYSQRNSKILRSQRESSSKAQIPSYLGKTQNNFHKESARYFSGEEVCVMKKEKVLNLSNFLVIDNEGSPEIFTTIPKQQFQEDNKGSSRGKPPKNIVAFIRRRNLSYLKQQFSSELQDKKDHKKQKKPQLHNFSPLRRTNASCQLKRAEEQINEGKPTHIFQRPPNASPEMNCTSPSFRNRKMSNYMKYRLGLGRPQKNLYF